VGGGRGWAPAGQTRRRVVTDNGAARARETRREQGEPKANMGGGERVRAHLWARGESVVVLPAERAGAEPRERRCPYAFLGVVEINSLYIYIYFK
jgi:hypothetical protein